MCLYSLQSLDGYSCIIFIYSCGVLNLLAFLALLSSPTLKWEPWQTSLQTLRMENSGYPLMFSMKSFLQPSSPKEATPTKLLSRMLLSITLQFSAKVLLQDLCQKLCLNFRSCMSSFLLCFLIQLSSSPSNRMINWLRRIFNF